MHPSNIMGSIYAIVIAQRSGEPTNLHRDVRKNVPAR